MMFYDEQRQQARASGEAVCWLHTNTRYSTSTPFIFFSPPKNDNFEYISGVKISQLQVELFC